MTNLIALPSGTELVGDYRIERVLGAGGFGVTYLADEIALERMVTIKEYFPSDFAARADGIMAAPRSLDSSGDYRWGLDRFIEEAQTLAKFNHPHIVRVYRYFRANNTGYMVLHFEEGQSFKSWLKGLGRAPRQKELDGIIQPLLDALQLIHAEDFLHRDIAPDNIIIRKDGTPVLIDFGSARGEIVKNSKTVSALVKPGYSPFEQYAANSRQQGAWTDIYALAATLYHAVTGKRPPDSPSRMVNDEFVLTKNGALSSYRPGFLAAIDKALALPIDKRPQSIAAWRGDLLAPEEVASKPGLFSRNRAKKKKDAAHDSADSVAPIAAATQSVTPPPPDAPGPQGGMLDFLDRFKKKPATVRATPLNDRPATAKAHQQQEPLTAALARAEPVAHGVEDVIAVGAGGGAAAAAPSADTVKLNTLPKPVSFPGWRRKDRDRIRKNADVGGQAKGIPAKGKAEAQEKQKAAKTKKAKKPKASAASTAAKSSEKKILPPALLERRRPPRPRPARSSRRWMTSIAMKLLIGAGIATGAVMIQQRLAEIRIAGVDKPAKAERKSARANPARKTAKAASRDTRNQTGSISRTAPKPKVVGIPLKLQFSGHTGGVTSVAFAEGDGKLVSVGKDGMLSVWEAKSGTLTRTIMLDHGAATSLDVQGQRAVTGHEDGHIDLWDLGTGLKISSFRRNEASIWSVTFTGNGQRVAAAAHDWKVTVWDASSPATPIHVFGAHENAVQAIAFSAAGPYLATGGADRSVKLWRLDDFKGVRSYRRHRDFITALAFSPDGRRLAAATLDGEIRLWATNSRRRRALLRGHKRGVKGVSFSPDGSLIASASSDGTVRLWRARDGRAVKTIAHQSTGALSVAFNSSGSRIATAGADGTIRLWGLDAFTSTIAQR